MTGDSARTTKVAAVADLHVREGVEESWRDVLADIANAADILVLAGDLTNRGLPGEAKILARELEHYRLPVVAVLGNHDFESGQQEEVRRILARSGVRMLQDEAAEIDDVGFAGVKGFAGGFDTHMLEPWGEQMVKDFVFETVNEAMRLEGALATLRTPKKIAVLHYAPISETVEGEPEVIFPFLGSSRLVEPICRFDVSAVFHGHAHHGKPKGKTANGIAVYNVSLPLLLATRPDQPFALVEV
ncbi:MAG: metallophosphoesterase family protein [Chloroflexota bacterium]